MALEWHLYRRKHNLDKSVKIFICKGYVSLKRELIRRGWHENTSMHSSIFHLKFVVKKEDLFKVRVEKYRGGEL